MTAVQGDARHLPFPDASVDLIVTSPPYFALRAYEDGGEQMEGQIGVEPTPAEFLEALWACTREWQRVLKPSGNLWVNLGDKYASDGGTRGGHERSMRGVGRGYDDGSGRVRGKRQWEGGARPKSLMGLPWRYAIGCIDGRAGDPWVLRAEVIWDKPNGMPESVTDRVRRSHEQLFHLTREGDHYANIDEVREPNSGDAHNLSRHERGGRQGGLDDRHDTSGAHPLGRLPGSVWSIPTEPLMIPDAVKEAYGLPDHYAAFPQELPRRIVLGWSPPGGVVVDPFGGTGTTAGAARALGRVGVSVDLSHGYGRLAQWFLRDGRRFAKTASRTDRDRQGALL